MASSPASSYDCSFKVLLIGDSAVGKSSLLVSFVSAAHMDDDIAPTIGTCALGWLLRPRSPAPDGSRRCLRVRFRAHPDWGTRQQYVLYSSGEPKVTVGAFVVNKKISVTCLRLAFVVEKCYCDFVWGCGRGITTH